MPTGQLGDFGHQDARRQKKWSDSPSANNAKLPFNREWGGQVSLVGPSARTKGVITYP
jgi:hypothetical protein